VCPDVHLEQVRFLDHTLVPHHTDLDQNDEPEVAQRGRSLDAYQSGLNRMSSTRSPLRRSRTMSSALWTFALAREITM